MRAFYPTLRILFSLIPYRLLIRSQGLCKELRDIKKQQRSWSTEREKKEVEKRTEIWQAERNIRRAIQPFAKTSCLSLCESICNNLPREIRDMIYEYLYDHDTIYVGPEYFTKTTQPCQLSLKAHYWDNEYVGRDMQREIVESWYRTTLFYFYDKAANVKVTQQFLVTDKWGLGIEPRHFFCHARIELCMDNVLHRRRGSPYYDKGPCCVVTDAGHKLIKSLKNFEGLPNHVEFFIRIHTYNAPETGCMSKEELRDAIRVVVKELETLHQGGHRLILQWPNLDNVELSWKKDSFSVDGWTKRLEVAAELVPEEMSEQGMSDEDATI